MAFERLKSAGNAFRDYASTEDTDGDAAHAGDPHSWEDPDKKSLRERIAPKTLPEKLVATAVIFLFLGILLNSLPLIQVLYLNPLTMVVAVLTASHALVAVWGMRKGWSKRVDYALSAVHSASSGVTRRGKVVGETDSYYIFESIKGLTPTGYLPSYLTIGDLFPNSRGLRAKFGRAEPGEDLSEVPARDRLPKATTVRLQTETEGDVLLTQAGDAEGNLLKLDDTGAETDRFATTPVRPDIEMARAIAEELDKLNEEIIPGLEERLNIRSRRLQDLREESRSSEDPSLQRSLAILTSLSEVMQTMNQNPSREDDDLDQDVLDRVKDMNER